MKEQRINVRGTVLMMHPERFARIIERAVRLGYEAGQDDQIDKAREGRDTILREEGTIQ